MILREIYKSKCKIKVWGKNNNKKINKNKSSNYCSMESDVNAKYLS